MTGAFGRGFAGWRTAILRLMRSSRLHRRGFPALGLTIALLFSALVSAGSQAASGGVRFANLPAKVFEGQRVTITAVVAPASKRCTLTINYAGNRTDHRAAIARGKATWTLRIPNVPPGTATLTASCPGAGTVTEKLEIQWATEAPKIVVSRRGFTQRVGNGYSAVSYGLALVNKRTRSDAINVAVLVNFVDSANRVLGTAHTGVTRLPASSTYYLGGQQTIGTKTTVARIEVVIEATSAANELATPPLISDVVLTQSPFEPYMAGVSGQLLNHYPLSMQSGNIGVVILDSSGTIVGGGTGAAQGPLAHGAREFFSAIGTFNAIPMSNAASALISVVPTYPRPSPTATS
jgi:hypothetical protein